MTPARNQGGTDLRMTEGQQDVWVMKPGGSDLRTTHEHQTTTTVALHLYKCVSKGRTPCAMSDFVHK